MEGYTGFIVVTFQRVKLVQKNCFSSASISIDRFTITLISRKCEIFDNYVELIRDNCSSVSSSRHKAAPANYKFTRINVHLHRNLLSPAPSFANRRLLLYLFSILILCRKLYFDRKLTSNHMQGFFRRQQGSNNLLA